MNAKKTAAPVESEEAVAGESKADAFKRIAARRTNKALDALAVLENTFNKNNYEFTQEQADKIVAALNNGIEKIVSRAGGEAPTKTGFAL